jgi:hypothetical protein
VTPRSTVQASSAARCRSRPSGRQSDAGGDRLHVAEQRDLRGRARTAGGRRGRRGGPAPGCPRRRGAGGAPSRRRSAAGLRHPPPGPGGRPRPTASHLLLVARWFGGWRTAGRVDSVLRRRACLKRGRSAQRVREGDAVGGREQERGGGTGTSDPGHGVGTGGPLQERPEVRADGAGGPRDAATRGGGRRLLARIGRDARLGARVGGPARVADRRRARLDVGPGHQRVHGPGRARTGRRRRPPRRDRPGAARALASAVGRPARAGAGLRGRGRAGGGPRPGSGHR